MKFSEFTRVFALAGLAAAIVVVGSAQQSPSSSATPAKPSASTPTPPTPPTPPSPAAVLKSDIAPDTVILTVGDVKMTREQFERFVASVAPNAATPAAKRQIAEKYAELEAMAQEARKRMLDQNADVKQLIAVQISLQTDNVLASTLAKKINEDLHFTDLDLRAYYDAHKDEFEEAKGSHILIRFKGSRVPLKPNQKDLTDAEALAKAQDIRAKIVAGGDFAALAKAESDDSGSGAKGGDLGTFKHGQMVPAFDKAAFSAPIGEVTEPVKTDFGYHIIKITSRTAKSFDDAKPEIEKELKPKMMKEAVEKVKAQTPTTINEEYFGK